ncbi:MAG: TetR family transcriptional regulator, partial [Actinobacteria bacterium]|nr:TetR family transcriptional regulator [Actinomycetota bacterium]
MNTHGIARARLTNNWLQRACNRADTCITLHPTTSKPSIPEGAYARFRASELRAEASAVRLERLAAIDSARAAGVTRPVVYEHFADRDALLVALLRRHAARVASHVAQAAEPGRSFADELTAATAAYLEVACRSGPAMRALVSAEGRSPAIEEARRTSPRCPHSPVCAWRAGSGSTGPPPCTSRRPSLRSTRCPSPRRTPHDRPLVASRPARRCGVHGARRLRARRLRRPVAAHERPGAHDERA